MPYGYICNYCLQIKKVLGGRNLGVKESLESFSMFICMHQLSFKSREHGSRVLMAMELAQRYTKLVVFGYAQILYKDWYISKLIV